MPLWELQLDTSRGSGWVGWRVELSTPKREAKFSYDERDNVQTPLEAVTTALQTDLAADFIEKGRFEIKIVEIRTVISAEVNPN